MAGVEAETDALAKRLVATDAEVNARCYPLENAKRELYLWKEEMQVMVGGMCSVVPRAARAMRP